MFQEITAQPLLLQMGLDTCKSKTSRLCHWFSAQWLILDDRGGFSEKSPGAPGASSHWDCSAVRKCVGSSPFTLEANFPGAAKQNSLLSMKILP